MTESIAEMVIPGTYIEVRAEGLIGVGGIVTGNIGIVGTAARGPVGAVRTLSSLADAIDIYGLPDAFGAPRLTNTPLTLVRALQQAFEGGARTVLAVRAANLATGNDELPVAASFGVTRASDASAAFTLTAKGHLDRDKAPIANSSGTWGQDITVTTSTDAATGTHRLALSYRKQTEVFEAATLGDLRTAATASRLVDVSALTGAATGGPTPAKGPMTGGADGANVGVTDLADALGELENEPVNILLVAGEASKRVGNIVQGHLQRTLNEGRERIAILGVAADGSATDVGDVTDEAGALENDRVVLVAPGLVSGTDTLPASYTAAVVAGKLATLAPHVSLTNKSLPVTPSVRYSTGSVTTLLGAQVLVVREKFGNQVVRGITTSAPPFSQISVRRTVDYAKAGVRLGSDPYIGRLNNARVRAALQATLDGFLSQMVLDEMLTGYELSVTATRAQEIAGVCAVVMNLKPTFSIDFIRVTMNLE
ncbi:phage tail sheath C-terminal domain-containing protein [Nocardioides jejuensis]|uniref:Phage tail protein n=1 Tax=Nocardioides jejuensis TaxID=2502782 RepID=A0A4R1CEB1_9ACTN|nr:phage tail sheath C-terminal domain-containing protein [Nocardioides jejuensis]TCJ28937.1 phage tail protein [Nocardioides jejuensis]